MSPINGCCNNPQLTGRTPHITTAMDRSRSFPEPYNYVFRTDNAPGQRTVGSSKEGAEMGNISVRDGNCGARVEKQITFGRHFGSPRPHSRVYDLNSFDRGIMAGLFKGAVFLRIPLLQVRKRLRGFGEGKSWPEGPLDSNSRQANQGLGQIHLNLYRPQASSQLK